MNSKEIALFSAKILDKKKGIDIVIIDIEEKSSFADFFVLASGNSERQIDSLSDEIESSFEKEGILLKGIEGKPPSGWILMDYGDVIINILTVEMRERYKIEKVWGDCEIIILEDENAEQV
jgi:ribosome-associated protein